MNVKEINDKVQELRTQIATARTDAEALEQKATILAEDLVLWQAKKINAERAGEDAAKDRAIAKIAAIEAELQTTKESAIAKKDELVALQSQLDGKINELKSDPGMKAHLNEVMFKRLSRDTKRLEKEKQKFEEKRDKLIVLKELITDHPTLGNNLKGILMAKKKIEDLEAQIAALPDPTGADRAAADDLNNKLTEAKEKLTTNKDSLMSYITRNSIALTEKDIEDFTSTKAIDDLATKDGDFAFKAPVFDDKGELDLMATLSRNVKALNRQIKGRDKCISNNEIAIETLVREESETREAEAIATPEPATVGAPSTGEPEKLKWWQFIKRFKNWRESKRAAALPPVEPVAPEAPEAPAARREVPRDMEDSLRYGVVREVYDAAERDARRAAKAVRRAEEREEER